MAASRPSTKTVPVKRAPSLGLRLKFNLVLGIVFTVGMGLSALVSHRLLIENAKQEAVRTANLMMEAALAIREYTVQHVGPQLTPLMQEHFMPQSVPAFAATETLQRLRQKYPEFSYREATRNPTNPRNRALEWEADIITSFSDQPDDRIVQGERDTPVGRTLFVAHAIQVKDRACLSCHGDPAAAPAPMVKLYGPQNGFGWQDQEVVGAQIVQVPLSVPLRHANEAFITFMASLTALFLAIFGALNSMLTRMIIRPITSLAQRADRISTGDFSVPEFSDQGGDEIKALGASFNRMRRSLQKAMKIIER